LAERRSADGMLGKGQRRTAVGELHPDGCRIPEGALVGEPSRGYRLAMKAFDTGRIGIAALAVGVEALQIHGASGYSRSLPLERYVRDAKLTKIYEGTNQIQREVLARQLLG
jgi:alkylation response protein AidB-like acyl-CoA dehydrogenase